MTYPPPSLSRIDFEVLLNFFFFCFLLIKKKITQSLLFAFGSFLWSFVACLSFCFDLDFATTKYWQFEGFLFIYVCVCVCVFLCFAQG